MLSIFDETADNNNSVCMMNWIITKTSSVFINKLYCDPTSPQVYLIPFGPDNNSNGFNAL